MKPDLDVAATLECEPELLPYLPEILQDFDALGSDPPRLIELLETQGVADEIRTGLDICCGKGRDFDRTGEALRHAHRRHRCDRCVRRIRQSGRDKRGRG